MAKDEEAQLAEEASETDSAVEAELKKLEKLSIAELAALDKQLGEARSSIAVQQQALQAELDRRNTFIVGEKQVEWSKARYEELVK